MASDSRPQGERRDLRLTSPRRRGRRPAFAATPDNRETLAKSGETKRSEGETKGFVWPATRRSNATAAKPAISPSRAFSMDWPRFCFASAKTPPAERAMAPVRGRTAGGNGHGGISDGQRTFYQNSDIQKAIVCSRYDRPSLSTARKWASGQADAALFSRCRAVAFGAVDPTHGSAKRRPRNGATLSAERGVCSRRRRGILTLAYCHCIVSLHRFTEAADGQNR